MKEDTNLQLIVNLHLSKQRRELIQITDNQRISLSNSNTDFSLDAEFKLDLINDILASKEMYVGRYYFDRKKWIPAINRFREIIDNYDTTIYAEEALHRLVEVHYTIGLIDEAEKYAQLLGYNYQSSKWYENTYSLFDKTYEKRKKERVKTYKKKSKGLIKKFKTLLE